MTTFALHYPLRAAIVAAAVLATPQLHARLASSPTSTVVAVASTVTPLPGTIEAEDFDDGPAHVAYFDATAGNEGGVYRQTDVDLEACDDLNGGFNIGWAGADEWLNYTVDIAVAGRFTIEARVASPAAGGGFHIEVDGMRATPLITVPDTGGWQSWTTLTERSVALPAGRHVLRLVMDTNATTGAVGNFNWLRVSLDPTGTSAPYHGAPSPVPGTIEAEDFDHGGEGIAYHDVSTGNAGGAYRETDVDVERTSGAGHNLGWVSAGEWLNYTVAVAATGNYAIDVRVASPVPGGIFHLEMNGADITGPIAVPETGDWQTWTTVTHKDVRLDAGEQRLRLVMDAAAPSTMAIGNFDWIRFTPIDPPGLSLKITAPAPGTVLRTTSVTFRWEGAGEDHWLDIGSVPGAGDIYASGWVGARAELTVDHLPLSGQPLYVRLRGRIGPETQSVSATYTAPIRKGLLVITDFADRVLEDWTGVGMQTVADVSAELQRMSDHWAWLSRGREKIQWDIIRVQLPQNVSGAFPSWTDFREAVAALAKAQIDIRDYDINSDDVVDAAWFIVSSGDIPAEYAMGGASRHGGVNMFVDGQASGSVEGKATGNFNHELGHLLGLPDMYGKYGTMGSLTVMGFSWPVPPPDFSAYERIALGWLTPRLISETTAGVWLPSANDTLAAVKVPTTRPTEYFLVEYRQRPASGYGSGEIGLDKKPVQYDGLAVYHVLEGSSMAQDPPLMKLEPADGVITPSTPTEGNNFLSPENPGMVLPMVLYSYYGDATEVFRIEHVVRRDGGIAFDVDIAPPPLSPANLLQNPSFELGDVLPSGWYKNAYLPMPAAFIWPSAEAVSGSRSAELDVPSDNDAAWVQTVNNLVPGQSYELCGWLKGRNIAGFGNTGANISILGGYIGAGGQVGTFDWTQSCVIFTATSTSADVACRLGFYGSTISGQMWCDDISLIRMRRAF